MQAMTSSLTGKQWSATFWKLCEGRLETRMKSIVLLLLCAIYQKIMLKYLLSVMKWYCGSLPEALDEAKRLNKVFVVYIEDESDMSRRMTATYNDPVVTEKLASQNCAALKITANSISHQQFQKIYGILTAPISIVIRPDGSILQAITRSLAAKEFCTKLDYVFKLHAEEKTTSSSPSEESSFTAASRDVKSSPADPSEGPSVASVESPSLLSMEDAGQSSSTSQENLASSSAEPVPPLEHRLERAEREAKEGKDRVMESVLEAAVLPMEPIPFRTRITDTSAKSWIVGNQLGSGGSGVIYEGSDGSLSEFNFAIKIEDYRSTSLCVEVGVFGDICKEDRIARFTKEKGLQFLGMPVFCGTGNFQYRNKTQRFLIMPKYGRDMLKILNEQNRMHPKTVFTVGIKVVDVLEYMHSFNYVHCDIKGGNIVLGPTKETINQVYLIDMGLTAKYKHSGVHTKEEPECKIVNGTPEVMSVDAHNGAFSRRSDLEALGYNMLLWLTGSLPWSEYVNDQGTLKAEKERCKKDVPKLMKTLFADPSLYLNLQEYMIYVAQLKFKDDPDYERIRRLLHLSIVRLGFKDDEILFLKDSKEATEDVSVSSENHQLKEAKEDVSVSSEKKTGEKRQLKEAKEDVSVSSEKKTGEKRQLKEAKEDVSVSSEKKNKGKATINPRNKASE